MKQKVTVIIPTYSRAKYINRAINSILNQTYKNFEIIVVDDNNSDSQERKTMEKIMLNYKDNNLVKYLKHEKNLNGASARNTGLKNATGDFITFLDDDDIFMPERLEECVKVLNNNPEYGGVYTNVIIMKNGKILSSVLAKKNGNFIKETLLRKPIIGTGSNMFFRKKVIDDIGFFDETFIRHQDLEYLVRFFKKYKIMNINKYLVIKDDSDRSNVVNVEKSIDCRLHFLNKFSNEIKVLSVNNDIMYLNYISLAMLSLYNKKYKYFKKMKLEAEKFQKINFKIRLKFILGFISGYVNLLNVRSFFSRIKLNVKLEKDIKNKIKYLT